LRSFKESAICSLVGECIVIDEVDSAIDGADEHVGDDVMTKLLLYLKLSVFG